MYPPSWLNLSGLILELELKRQQDKMADFSLKPSYLHKINRRPNREFISISLQDGFNLYRNMVYTIHLYSWVLKVQLETMWEGERVGYF